MLVFVGVFYLYSMGVVIVVCLIMYLFIVGIVGYVLVNMYR